MVIERHVHPSKYEIFLTSGGRGVFKVWAPGAADGDEARETFELKPGVCCTIGPEEPHEIRAAPDSDLRAWRIWVWWLPNGRNERESK